MNRYEIAGLKVDMAVSGRTQRQAAAYAAPAKCPADIEPEIDAAALENNPRLRTLDTAEYMRSGAMFARRLLDFGGFQLHSSAIILDGRAYLFSAFSICRGLRPRHPVCDAAILVRGVEGAAPYGISRQNS